MKIVLLLLCLIGCTIAKLDSGPKPNLDFIQERGRYDSDHYDDYDDDEDYDFDDHDDYDDDDDYDDHSYNKRKSNRKSKPYNSFSMNNANGFSLNNVAVQTYNDGDRTRVKLSQNGYNVDYSVLHSRKCQKHGYKMNDIMNSGGFTAQRARDIASRSNGCIKIYSITKQSNNGYGTSRTGQKGQTARMGQRGNGMSTSLQMGVMVPVPHGAGMPGMHGVPGMHMDPHGMGMMGMHMDPHGMGMMGLPMAAGRRSTMNGNVRTGSRNTRW